MTAPSGKQPVEVVRITDPATIRAVAHPKRARIIAHLRRFGPATSTALAEALGESSGSMSYHLRQLARHSLIVELAERGNQRERWWQPAGKHFEFDPAASSSPEYARAIQAVRAQILQRDADAVAQFLESEAEYPPAWRSAAAFGNEQIFATASELDELVKRLETLLEPFRRPEPAERPADGQPVHFGWHAVPTSRRDRP